MIFRIQVRQGAEDEEERMKHCHQWLLPPEGYILNPDLDLGMRWTGVRLSNQGVEGRSGEHTSEEEEGVSANDYTTYPLVRTHQLMHTRDFDLLIPLSFSGHRCDVSQLQPTSRRSCCSCACAHAAHAAVELLTGPWRLLLRLPRAVAGD